MAGQHWIALFGKVGVRQVGLTLVDVAVTLTASIAVTLVLKQFVSFSGNPVSLASGEMTTLQFAGREITAPLGPKRPAAGHCLAEPTYRKSDGLIPWRAILS